MKACRYLSLLPLGMALGGINPLAGQVRLNDLVITGGAAMEVYLGNFSAVTVAQIDSTDSALAGVGHWTARGSVNFLPSGRRALWLDFDGGVRQFATGGFQLRNYAPREHSGRLTMTYGQRLAGGTFTTEATARARSIADRPPMPLYLSPGYETYTARVGYGRSLRPGLDLSVAVTGEKADYSAPKTLPQLDLLDRSSVIVRTEAVRDFRDPARTEDFSKFGVFAAYRHHSYPKQGLGLLRADHALGGGVSYERETDRLVLRLSLDGTLSRSNAPRVEYNAAVLKGELTWSLGTSTQLDFEGTLARKRYRNRVQDHLVPGEEGDNASLLYAEVTRFLSPQVDASFRFGWQKVETNISGAYYTRFGGTFFLKVRPGF